MKTSFPILCKEKVMGLKVQIKTEPAPTGAAHLPSEAQVRKEMPIYRGVLRYFPDAIAEISHVSFIGNEQHNPGQPMHWARDKSTDHADCIVRHLIDAGTFDSDGIRHSAKVAWRALALLQVEIENERKATQRG